MRESRTSGSVGAGGGQPPSATRQSRLFGAGGQRGGEKSKSQKVEKSEGENRKGEKSKVETVEGWGTRASVGPSDARGRALRRRDPPSMGRGVGRYNLRWVRRLKDWSAHP